MSRISSARRKQEDDEIDITPMIDMTFLLLIFFLLTSKLDSGSEVTLPKALHGVPVAAKQSVVITVKSVGNDGVEVYLGEGTDPSDRVTATEPEPFREAIQDAVNKGLKEDKEQVLIRASRDVKHKEIAKILRAIGDIEGATSFVAVLEES
jgi:biopolymer transport protein ExbD